MIKSRYQKNVIIAFFIVFLMFCWNLITPLLDDDLVFASQRAGQFIKLAISEYFHWNPRVWGQLFTRLLTRNPQWLMSMINAMVFVAFIALMTLIASENNKLIPYKFLLSFLLFFLFIQHFGETVLWRAGAGNYLWTLTFDLLIVTLYRSDFFFANKSLSQLVLAYCIATFGGLIAGWSNENTSIGIIILMIYFTAMHQVEQKKISPTAIIGIISAIIGWMIMIISPGAKERTILTMGKDYFKTPVYIRFLHGFVAVSKTLVHQLIPLACVAIISLTVMSIFYVSKRKLINSLILMGTGTAVIYALSLSPTGQGGGRTFFGGITLIIVGIVTTFPDDLSKISRKLRIIESLIAVLLLVVSVFNVYFGMLDSYKEYRAVNLRYAYIWQQRKITKGQKIIKVPDLQYYAKTPYCANYGVHSNSDLTNNPTQFPNNTYPQYFKVKGVIRSKNAK